MKAISENEFEKPKKSRGDVSWGDAFRGRESQASIHSHKMCKLVRPGEFFFLKIIGNILSLAKGGRPPYIQGKLVTKNTHKLQKLVTGYHGNANIT